MRVGIVSAGAMGSAVGRALLAARQVLEVGARGERAAGAGDDDGAHVVVLGDLLNGGEEIAAELAPSASEEEFGVAMTGGGRQVAA